MSAPPNITNPEDESGEIKEPMAFVGLTSFLEERGAQDAELILLEAGVERVEDLEPLLNPEDLHNCC